MQNLPIVENSTTSPSSRIVETDQSFSKGHYAFITLGCPKNLVDSEKMLGTLALDGYTLVSEPEDSDFVIVNTCGFIEQSRQESRAVINEMLDLKRQGKTKGVIVAGCLPERLGGSLLQEMPEIDHIVGVFGRDEMNRVADQLVGGASEQRELFRPAPIRAQNDQSRLRITPRHYAYLKISEGCDRTCTFCAIPKMRGKHVTKPMEMVIEEARELVSDGVRELVIVAQDTTYYGTDLYGEVRLAPLLKELDQIDGLDWIRLMYLYPINFSDELITTIADSSKIIPYLDLPLQHINDTMLKRMQRRVSRAQTIELIDKLRATIPNLVLRTTLITGFPGETDAQFQQLKDFVCAAEFQRMGVFTYSLEPGTAAERLPSHLTESIKATRRDELMEVQQQIAFRFGDSLIGYELDVLVDKQINDETWVGRTYADAPEIDGVVYISGPGIKVGELLPVEILERRDYDLAGVSVLGVQEPETAEAWPPQTIG